MSRFPTTQWSLVRRATDDSATGSREDMGQLLDRYWQPMYQHLLFKGLQPNKAEDLIQDFVVDLIEKNLLAIADPAKGRFRSLLLVMLDRFRFAKHRYDNAAKRAPEKLASLDALPTDQAGDEDGAPSLVFERAWCLDVLAQALASMQQECSASGDALRWDVFESRVLKPLFEADEPATYGELAARHGLANEKAAMNQLVTAKRQFARTMRGAVRDYVTRLAGEKVAAEECSVSDVENSSSDGQLNEHMIAQEIEGELSDLRDILARSRHLAGSIAIADDKRDPAKSGFWRQMAQSDKPLAAMFEWGVSDIDDDDDSLRASFENLMDAPLATIPGLGFDGEGTLRACVDDPEPPLTLLTRLKDWSNVQRMGGNRAMPAPLSKALYFIICAVALNTAGTKITGAHDAALKSGFEWLQQQSWFPDSMHPHLQRAAAALADKA